MHAALAPLYFAARNDFERLSRIRDLASTLEQSLQRARQAAFGDEVLCRHLQVLQKSVPQDASDTATRVDGFKKLTRAIEDIVSALDQQHGGVDLAQSAPMSSSQQTKSMPAPPPAAPKAVAPQQDPKAPTTTWPADAPLSVLKGVGARAQEQLRARNLINIEDLLRFLPRRYQSRNSYQDIASLKVDSVASVEGDVQSVFERFVRGRRSLEITLADGSGHLVLVWFRVPGRGFAAQFVKGTRFRAAGTVKRFRNALQMAHPEVVRLSDAPLGVPEDRAHTDQAEAQASADRVLPLYLDVEGLHPTALRRLIKQALPSAANIVDPLPHKLVQRRKLVTLAQALQALHEPDADACVETLLGQQTPAHRRLIYEELFFLQLGLMQRRHQRRHENNGVVLPMLEPIEAMARRMLPFSLTRAQQRAVDDIMSDLKSGRAMQRLLQGDVGSGKTAVALLAALVVCRAHMQTALMAPTELLAIQHLNTATKLLAPLGVRVALLSGKQGVKERRQINEDLAKGRIDVVVGTHALIQNDICFCSLALAIIDEQHRFGVMQRARLSELGHAGLGATPHTLVMTATPIPRTLALTVYGDLDLSLIDELPPGRTPIITKLYQEAQRTEAYEKVLQEVAAGRQAYVVFPLVEESDKEGMAEIRAATTSIEELRQGPLAGLRLSLLHGRLSTEEKQGVMQAFLRRETDVLVATTVIEVGIDVSNATVMVIEHAERFGLSQLHQLRGRVGRAANQSYCLLLARKRGSHSAWRRLTVMEKSNDGFVIAEEDLALRGPGDFTGTRQSGLPLLSMANLARDQQVLLEARQDAEDIIEADPALAWPQHQALRKVFAARFRQGAKMMEVG